MLCVTSCFQSYLKHEVNTYIEFSQTAEYLNIIGINYKQSFAFKVKGLIKREVDTEKTRPHF